tara:strand:+ start:33 stop:563 length:531 start_codon:yes stop_codon:yes gene_type:complete
MALSSGLSVSCSDSTRRGGVKKLWITDVTNITSFTAGSSHEFNAVVVASGTFRKYQYEDFSFSVSSEGSKENGSSVINHSIEFTIPKMSKEKAALLQEVVDLCKAVLVIEDYNDHYFVVGWDNILEDKSGLHMTVDQVIGAGLQDSNHYIVKGSGVSAELFREYTGDVTDAADFEQ